MIEIPGKNHVMHRATARVILKDREGCFLLLNTHYDARLQLPPRWITPGGAIDEGESIPDAAARELLEETGMSLAVDELGEQFAEYTGAWEWGDGVNYHTYVDNFFVVTVDRFEIDTSGWTPEERHDVIEYRWWDVEEFRATQPTVGPPELIDLLERAGRR
jgi:8-oxo-dGTP pyrophosphatase MutT (NUDIX family)